MNILYEQNLSEINLSENNIILQERTRITAKFRNLSQI